MDSLSRASTARIEETSIPGWSSSSGLWVVMSRRVLRDASSNASISLTVAPGWMATSGSSMATRVGGTWLALAWKVATSTPSTRNVPSDMLAARKRHGASSPATF